MATGAADTEPEEDCKDSLADIVMFLPHWQCQYTHVQSIHIHVTAKIAHVQKSRDYAQTMPGLQTRNYAHYYASIICGSLKMTLHHFGKLPTMDHPLNVSDKLN